MNIKIAAAHGFNLLSTQYRSVDFSGNFWFAGNTFHTVLDYLLAAGINDATQPSPLVPFAHQLYLNLEPTSNWWRDDYGWWGDSFVLAINNRKALGYGASSYDPLFNDMLNLAGKCFDKMQPNWSNTPYDKASDHANGSANIVGGVYNLNDPTQDLAGRNSVTNEGYWLLAMGLAKLQPQNPAYGKAVNDIQNWMQQWLARTPAACDGSGQIGILDLQCHVLERPMGTVNAATWFWTGDQGLFCRALLTSGLQVARADSILNATMASLKDQSWVLHENMSFKSVYGQFTGDYATGKGIFMRSLSGFNLNPTSPLAKMIVESASAVWCNRNTVADPPGNRAVNQFTFNWNRNLQPQYEPTWLDSKGGDLDALIMQAAGQDALTAALRLNPNAEFPCD